MPDAGILLTAMTSCCCEPGVTLVIATVCARTVLPAASGTPARFPASIALSVATTVLGSPALFAFPVAAADVPLDTSPLVTVPSAATVAPATLAVRPLSNTTVLAVSDELDPGTYVSEDEESSELLLERLAIAGTAASESAHAIAST